MAPERRKLLVVTETFDIKNRGIIVAPDVDLGMRAQMRVDVELHRPDGSVLRAVVLAQVSFVSGLKRPHHMLQFETLSKQDVPIGTEVWLLGEA